MVEEQIDWRKTVEAILENANRPFVPISKSFIQQPRGSKGSAAACCPSS